MDNLKVNRRDIGKHTCQLRRTSGSTLPRLPPNAKILAHLKRKFQKLIIISESHPYAKYYLRSQAAMAFEKRRHQSSSYWWIIHPCSRLRFFWENLMTFVFLYFFITVPFVKTFYTICGRNKFNQYYLTIPAYVICIFDILMNFITGYISADSNAIILLPSLIARHYTQTFFLIDLITSIPYGWFTELGKVTLSGSEVNFIALIAELIPLLKILRLSTLRHYIKQIHAACGFTSVTDIIIWLSLLTTLIFHWSACLSWAYPFLVIHATRTSYEESDAYVIRSNIYKENTLRIYIISLHMGISNLFGSTFIEFNETSQADKLIRCILLLFGTCYMIYLIVVVLQMVESSAAPELKYQELMRRVEEYIYEKNLPSHLGQKLKSYYQYRFQGSYFKENTIVATLPNHLKQEINMRSNRGLLQTATIFHNLSKSLVTNIMTVVKAIIYLEGDIIYKADDIGDCMYFIVSGTVAIIHPLGKEIVHLEDGNHFGEMCIMQQDRQRKVSAIAVEITELLRFDQRHFKRIVIPNSELFMRFSMIINERMEQLEHANKIASAEIKQQRRRSSHYRKLLMRTGDLNLSSFSSNNGEEDNDEDVSYIGVTHNSY